jgi:GNAT superfamily N-acetyltransferase
MPGPTLSFRSFEAADRDAVVDLLSIGRPPGYLGLKTAVFDWQFLHNPHRDGRSPFLVGVLDDGRGNASIVALNGFMPVQIRFHNQPILASWSCDTYVSPSYRGRGFGKELLSRVSTAAPIMLGYGISDMSDPILAQQNWLLHPDIVLLFCHVAEEGITGRFKNFGSRLSRIRSGHAHPLSSEIICEDHGHFSAEVGELWAECRSGYPSTVERDAAYLNWKYHQHPLNRYISYAARSHGRLQGLMIARHDPEESVIVDYCGPAHDSQLMCDLAVAAVEDLRHRQTMRIRCETTHAPMVEALGRAGFLTSRHVSRFRVRSNLTQFDVLSGWFLMTGDSDNDLLPMLDTEASPRAPAMHQ